ncbi:MAG TPA: Hsp20/alpha crystallin family protein [Steroidobacteraceae bacterium]|nr:Hsp20/alpha crystallin family protein [Steroidobacteraceae bacterium]
MNIVNWEPFREMENLFNRYSRLVRRSDLNGDMDSWTPSADITETDKEYLIKANLPEVKKEDVKVTLESGALTISGERKQEKQEKGENEIRVESLYGSFSRSFMLPDNVDAANVRAESRDGVLKIHIPKKEAAKPRSITVDVK